MANYYPLHEGKPRWGMELQERLLDEALQVANVPGVVLQERVRPPLPQVDPWRPREGWPSKQERQIKIEDIIDVNRIYSDPRINWTGTPAGYSGSSTPSNEQS